MRGSQERKKHRKIIWIPATIAVLLAVGFIAFKLIFPGATFIGSARIQSVTSSVSAFQYDPGKIAVGEVYHYVKSNIDGSKPADVAIFVSSSDHIEVFKIYPGSSAVYYVTADMDWSVFSARSLDGYEIDGNGNKKLVMHAQLDKDKNEYLLDDGKNPYTVPVGHYPVHNYNFDLTSFNLAFRHLANPEEGFSFGVHYPAFDLTSFIRNVYSGKADVTYLEDDAYDSVECRKYSVSGEGLANRTGSVWVRKDKGLVQCMEIPLSDNPGWGSFRMELKGIEVMSQEAWNTFIAAQTQSYIDKLGR